MTEKMHQGKFFLGAFFVSSLRLGMRRNRFLTKYEGATDREVHAAYMEMSMMLGEL